MPRILLVSPTLAAQDCISAFSHDRAEVCADVSASASASLVITDHARWLISDQLGRGSIFLNSTSKAPFQFAESNQRPKLIPLVLNFIIREKRIFLSMTRIRNARYGCSVLWEILVSRDISLVRL